MKEIKYVLVVILFFAYSHVGYTQEKKLEISPLIGVRLHTDGLPGLRLGSPPRLITAPMIGVNISSDRTPFYLKVQKDWNLTINAYSSVDIFGTIGQYWTETNVLLAYRLKYFDVSIGYFLMERENPGNHIFGDGVVRNYQGLLLGIYKEFDWLGIEFRTKVHLHPFFDAIVGIDNYHLVLSYKFGNSKKSSIPIFDNKLALRATIGSRFFPVKGIEVLPNETFPKFGISPTLGVELLHVKTGLSFNAEKDIWISLNGGSEQRDIKGYIISTLIGFKYHVGLKNNRHLRMGIGYSLIRDLDKKSDVHKNGFLNYQVKGVGTSFSYEIIKNIDIELKHTFSIKSIDDESLFSPIRFSGGIIYRIQPK